MSWKVKSVFFGNNPLLLSTLIECSDVSAVFCRNAENEAIVNIKQLASKLQIPVFTPNKKELSSYIRYLKNLDADLFVVCGYKYIIPRSVFEIPSIASINIHPSLLPSYRGQHVINWAIINGEDKTGVTFHLVDDGIDTGDIVIQKEIPILSFDNASTIHGKLYCEASSMLSDLVENISEGHKLKIYPQCEDKATYFKPRTPKEGKIDWNTDGVSICNLVRGLVKPWPGAYFFVDDKKIVVWKCIFENTNIEGVNGEIVYSNNDLLHIKVKDGVLIIDDYSIYDEHEECTKKTIVVGEIAT